MHNDLIQELRETTVYTQGLGVRVFLALHPEYRAWTDFLVVPRNEPDYWVVPAEKGPDYFSAQKLAATPAERQAVYDRYKQPWFRGKTQGNVYDANVWQYATKNENRFQPPPLHRDAMACASLAEKILGSDIGYRITKPLDGRKPSVVIQKRKPGNGPFSPGFGIWVDEEGETFELAFSIALLVAANQKAESDAEVLERLQGAYGR